MTHRSFDSRFLVGTVLTGLAISATAPATQAAPVTDWLDIHGVADIRLVATSDAWEWLDDGLGKLRYGSGSRTGDARELFRVGEASLVFIARPAFEWKAVVHVKTDQEADFAPDIVEAFVEYAPAPSSRFSWQVKAGAFFPPISMENTGLAWTSPYTLSSSALNAWIGEEVRTIGGELRVSYDTDNVTYTAIGALFGFNDPAGTILAWRGWSPHDWEAGLFDKFPLANNLWALRPGFLDKPQDPYVSPIAEIDNRIGVYAGLRAKSADWQVDLLAYDNRADPTAFENGQYAWKTRFLSAGVKYRPLPGLTLISQAMLGETQMGVWRSTAAVKADFWTAFALASYRFAEGTHQISARIERFGTDDKDGRAFDPNDERGWAYTVSHDWRLAGGHRITTEVLHVTSTRPDRLDAGYPSAREEETQLQLAYRYFF